jgi:hypothetical protein
MRSNSKAKDIGHATAAFHWLVVVFSGQFIDF